MGYYYKPTQMTKGEYTRYMCDKIENAIGITGTAFSYDILSVPVSEEDKVFRKSYSEILLVMKDRGYKVWGTPPEGNICKLHFSKD